MSLTDARRMYVLLRDAGAEGVHSHDLRRQGVSGNPSQRAKDIVSKGVAVSVRRENVGRRPGARYWLAEHAPQDANAVLPNRAAAPAEPAARGRGEAPHAPAAVSLSPAAGAKTCIFRDYSSEHGYRMGWQRVPLDAEGNPVTDGIACSPPRRQELQEAA